MKFLNWVQNKFNGGQANNRSKPNPVSTTHHKKHEPPKEEFSDWPHGLLAIGTFGHHDPKENPDQSRKQDLQQDHKNPSSSDDQEDHDDLSDFTPEEVGKLQKELTKLLRRKPAAPKVEGENAADQHHLPLDRFLNCPSSLEVSRRMATAVGSDSGDRNEEEDIDRTIRVIIDRCKDVCMEKNKKGIGKKLVSFLLKKMFVCSAGFAPSPSLRDTFPESRMEKLLRTMLSKKMYPQNASRASSMKQYLEDRPSTSKKRNKEEDEQPRGRTNDGCKWVKNDSEYIVLEI